MKVQGKKSAEHIFRLQKRAHKKHFNSRKPLQRIKCKKK